MKKGKQEAWFCVRYEILGLGGGYLYMGSGVGENYENRSGALVGFCLLRDPMWFFFFCPPLHLQMSSGGYSSWYHENALSIFVK